MDGHSPLAVLTDAQELDHDVPGGAAAIWKEQLMMFEPTVRELAGLIHLHHMQYCAMWVSCSAVCTASRALYLLDVAVCFPTKTKPM